MTEILQTDRRAHRISNWQRVAGSGSSATSMKTDVVAERIGGEKRNWGSKIG